MAAGSGTKPQPQPPPRCCDRGGNEGYLDAAALEGGVQVHVAETRLAAAGGGGEQHDDDDDEHQYDETSSRQSLLLRQSTTKRLYLDGNNNNNKGSRSAPLVDVGGIDEPDSGRGGLGGGPTTPPPAAKAIQAADGTRLLRYDGYGCCRCWNGDVSPLPTPTRTRSTIIVRLLVGAIIIVGAIRTFRSVAATARKPPQQLWSAMSDVTSSPKDHHPPLQEQEQEQQQFLHASPPPSLPPTAVAVDDTNFSSSNSSNGTHGGSAAEGHSHVSNNNNGGGGNADGGNVTKAKTKKKKTCSCYESFTTIWCCRRAILRAHKFGYKWAAQHFGMLRKSSDQKVILTEKIQLEEDAKGSSTWLAWAAPDYRHVVTVRNYLDAFVSGYLYHKSGRECWLTPDGQPRPNSRPDDEHGWWEDKIEMAQQQHPQFGWYPPQHNRSLCQYLVDESELDGMKVYVAFATSAWYPGLLKYLQATKGPNASKKMQHRTMFVCLEDASDLRKQESLYNAVMDHLFPGSNEVEGGGRYSRPYVVSKAGAKAMAPAHKDGIGIGGSSIHFNASSSTIASAASVPEGEPVVYSGAHSSNHDPDQWMRLRSIVYELDRTVFGGRIAASDNLMGCGLASRGNDNGDKGAAAAGPGARRTMNDGSNHHQRWWIGDDTLLS